MRSLKTAPRLADERMLARSDLYRAASFGRALACLAVLGSFTAAAWCIQQRADPAGNASRQSPTVAAPAGANETVQAQDAGPRPKDAAGADRKKIIADEGAQLLKLAADLKAEMDKTSKDTLSIGVIHKAEALEKLAHDVREEKFVAEGAK